VTIPARPQCFTIAAKTVGPAWKAAGSRTQGPRAIALNAGNEIAQPNREQTVTSGSAGFRDLMARKHGLHMGVDVALGPDEPIFYVGFGSAWLRH
jgi:glucose/arabinose dehydrogenase